ncbi:MAG: hypothetical protein AB1776_07620 [Bacillota bacterium]
MLISGGSPNFDRLLNEFTPEEIEGFRGFMRWISHSGDCLAAKPGMARKRMVNAFKDFVPTKGEEDLVRLFEALDKDLTEIVGERAPRPLFLKLFFYEKYKKRLRRSQLARNA